MNGGHGSLMLQFKLDESVECRIRTGTKAVELHESLARGGVGFNTAAGDVIGDILWAVFEGEGTLDEARELLERALGYYAEQTAEDADVVARRRALGKTRDKSNDYD